MASLLGCKAGEIPFIYLGLNVGAKMRLFKNWKPVLDVVESRLTQWKASTLSIGGRITLIRSVLDALPIYYFSLYRAPMRVIQKLEGIRSRFLWGGNKEKQVIHWVSWEKVKKKEELGGLGLTSLDELNISLLSKWLWRYKTEDGRLWREVVRALHQTRVHRFIPKKTTASGCWKQICNIEQVLESKSIRFSNLLEPRNGVGMTGWTWKLQKDGVFTVKSVRREMNKEDGASIRYFPWNKILPIKVNVFGWRLWLNRIPTKAALAVRNIQRRSQSCPFCEQDVEDVNHLFTGCWFSQLVWEEISKWCKIPMIMAFSVNDLIFIMDWIGGSDFKCRMIQLVVLITCWTIWKARNDLVFDRRRKIKTAEIINEVKALGWLWLKHRGNIEDFNEQQWLNFDCN